LLVPPEKGEAAMTPETSALIERGEIARGAAARLRRETAEVIRQSREVHATERRLREEVEEDLSLLNWPGLGER
jgi:hypothetical protein